jgi:hypothetical protein
MGGVDSSLASKDSRCAELKYLCLLCHSPSSDKKQKSWEKIDFPRFFASQADEPTFCQEGCRLFLKGKKSTMMNFDGIPEQDRFGFDPFAQAISGRIQSIEQPQGSVVAIYGRGVLVQAAYSSWSVIIFRRLRQLVRNSAIASGRLWAIGTYHFWVRIRLDSGPQFCSVSPSSATAKPHGTMVLWCQGPRTDTLADNRRPVRQACAHLRLFPQIQRL